MRTGGRGRPRKLTPERQKIILAAIEDGLTWTAAAGEAKVSYDIFARLMAEDADFRVAVEAAENAAEARMVRAAMAGRGAEPPKADAWTWLEKRRRKDWGKQQAVDVTQGGEVRIVFGYDDGTEEVGDG